MRNTLTDNQLVHNKMQLEGIYGKSSSSSAISLASSRSCFSLSRCSCNMTIKSTLYWPGILAQCGELWNTNEKKWEKILKAKFLEIMDATRIQEWLLRITQCYIKIFLFPCFLLSDVWHQKTSIPTTWKGSSWPPTPLDIPTPPTPLPNKPSSQTFHTTLWGFPGPLTHPAPCWNLQLHPWGFKPHNLKM